MPIKSILGHLASLHPVPAGLPELLACPNVLQSVALRKNECLIAEGSRNTRAYYVTKGLLKASVQLANGQEQIYLFWEANEIAVLEPAFFRSEPSPWQVSALGTAKLEGISRSDMDTIYARFPDMQRHTDIILRQQVDKRDRLIRILREPKGKRYALFQVLFPTLWKQLDNATVCTFLDISDKTLNRSKRG